MTDEELRQTIVDQLTSIARDIRSTDEAREVMGTLSQQNAKDMWVAIWNIEAIERLKKLRETDPDARFPPEAHLL